MKIVERMAITLSIIGFLLKVSIITGANEILMIGLTCLGLVYLILSFALFNKIPVMGIFKRSSYSSTGFGRLYGAIGIGITLWITVTAILFKILNLTGANEMLIIGNTYLALVLFAALLIFFAKNNRMDSYYKNIFTKGIFVLTIGVALYFLPPYTLVKLFHRDNPKYIELWIKTCENPKDLQAWKEFEDYKNGKK